MGVRRKRAASRVDDCSRRVVSESCADTGPATKARSVASARLEALGFIDQHYGNTVLNAIAQPARVAPEILFLFPVLEISLAFRTDEDFEKLGID
jgi:hypothetical protein